MAAELKAEYRQKLQEFNEHNASTSAPRKEIRGKENNLKYVYRR